MVNAWKPVLAAIVIFAAGVVTGSLVLDVATPQPARAFPRTFNPDRNHHGAEHRHGSRMEGQLNWLMRRIQRDLKLTDKQTAKVEAAFKESREEMKVAFEELRPRLRASTEKLKDKLRGDLTEEQIEKFSKYLRPPTSRDRFKEARANAHRGRGKIARAVDHAAESTKLRRSRSSRSRSTDPAEQPLATRISILPSHPVHPLAGHLVSEP